MNISIISPSWHEFPDQAERTIEQVLEIIEDATVNGFIFKVENHKIYFKEIC